MKNSIGVLLGGVLVAVCASSAPAQELTMAPEAAVRIVNHYTSAVEVYVFDHDDRRFSLGSVETGDFKQMVISTEWVEAGVVQIKVYPKGTPRGLAGSGAEDGVKSSKLTLSAGDVIDFWLEPDLGDSMVRVTHQLAAAN